jgi:hypothetical protein
MTECLPSYGPEFMEALRKDRKNNVFTADLLFYFLYSDLELYFLIFKI